MSQNFFAAVLIASVSGALHAKASTGRVCNSLAELGLTPECIAAVGMTLQEVQDGLGRLDNRDEEFDSIRDHRAEQAGLNAQLVELQRDARAAPTVEAAQDIAQEIVRVQSARSACDQAISLAYQTLWNSFVPTSIDAGLLQRVCRPAADLYLVPVEYRLVDWSEADRSDLVKAYSSQARAAALGQDFDSQTLAALNEFAATPVVQQARVRIEAQASAIQYLLSSYQD